MDGKGRRWTRWTAAILGISAFFALAGISAARLSSESASTTIAPQQNGTATAKCGSGRTAVAGGFAAPGLDPSAATGPAILTYASGRPGDGKWKAAGHNYNNPMQPKGTAGAGPIIAYAYCDKHDPSLKVATDSAIVASRGHATLTPKCPKSHEAVSGGFQSDAPQAGTEQFTDLAYTSKRAGDSGWKISVVNPDPLSHKVDAFAYCEKHAPKLVSRSASKNVPLADTASVSAKCPQGGKVVSGGYKSTFDGSDTGFVTSIAFTSKRSKDQSWKVSAIGAALSASQTSPPKEKAIVYCTT
jgi:hypothetical protein